MNIPIKRFFCKICEKTTSFIPVFLLPKKRYSAAIINESFKLYCAGQSISNITKTLNLCEESTLKRWLYPVNKSMRLIKQKGYALMRKFLHQVKETQVKLRSRLALYAFLESLSLMMENLGFLKRVPYHYALVLQE